RSNSRIASRVGDMHVAHICGVDHFVVLHCSPTVPPQGPIDSLALVQPERLRRATLRQSVRTRKINKRLKDRGFEQRARHHAPPQLESTSFQPMIPAYIAFIAARLRQ